MFSSHSIAAHIPSLRGAPVLPRWQRMMALLRSRHALAQLTPDQLDDIGVSARDAHTEAQRPVWDAPANWRD